MNCTKCQDVGYQISSSGEFAVAEVCDCQLNCKKCGGSGFLIENVDGYEVAKPCFCSSAPHRVTCYNRAQIPAHFAHKSLSGYQATHHNQCVQDTTKLSACTRQRTLGKVCNAAREVRNAIVVGRLTFVARVLAVPKRGVCVAAADTRLARGANGGAGIWPRTAGKH